ncbi:DUF305 domain-containing protein [Candidatus Phyllobacterium onerii]|uniref:CopM family metallochaperone n=1 Tax=Candidatus Phyllobacterium onerii TaxID=3020828 RepID=UPI00232D2471|nr:DUF305 domain-containing protein [Phyllobacterium sp. IY22]
MIRIILVAAAGVALVIPALAESMQMGKPMGDQGRSSHAFAEANAKMHKDMMIRYSGDADKDFVRVMIPHHQGASDMAEVELKYGKDPELRKIAEHIIKMQEKEISDFQSWLKTHGK